MSILILETKDKITQIKIGIIYFQKWEDMINFKNFRTNQKSKELKV